MSSKSKRPPQGLGGIKPVHGLKVEAASAPTSDGTETVVGVTLTRDTAGNAPYGTFIMSRKLARFLADDIYTNLDDQRDARAMFGDTDR